MPQIVETTERERERESLSEICITERGSCRKLTAPTGSLIISKPSFLGNRESPKCKFPLALNRQSLDDDVTASLSPAISNFIPRSIG